MDKQNYYKNPSNLIIADPFVYRWQGKYYMFGTGDFCPVFYSEDLINWLPIGTAISPEENNIDLLGCYAPEVVYFGGLFYLVYSPKGNEHRIFCSKELTKGYTPCKNVIFEGIDGSFFIEDDGKVTIFRSCDVKGKNKDGIYYSTESCPEKFNYDNWKRLSAGYLNGWTEGPFLVERNGYRFLTFTGNHYLSQGYRIDYATGKKNDYDNYTYQDSLIISTEPHYNGLGHSSTVVGPNLDSLIIAYHNIDLFVRKRYYNFTTLLTSGNKMYANGLCNYESEVPLKADFECFGKEKLILKEDEYYLPTEFDKYFTIEAYFKYDNSCNITLGKYKLIIKNGLAKLLDNTSEQERQITPIIKGATTFLRIENYKKLTIFINNQKVFEIDATLGEIGFDKNAEISYIAYSLDAGGSSNKKITKNIPSKLPINSCQEDEIFTFENDTYYLQNQVATFKINPSSSGKYAIVLTGKCQETSNNTININGKESNISLAPFNGKTILGIFDFSNKLTIFSITSTAKICELEFIKVDDTPLVLDSVDNLDLVYSGQNLPVPGKELSYLHTTNKTFNAKLSFEVDNVTDYCGGIALRENYFAHFPDHPTESFYGYLVAVFNNKLHFYKTAYGKTLLCEFCLTSEKIEIEFNNNQFIFYNNSKLLGSYTDENAIFYGHIGLLKLKNFNIKNISYKK